MYGQEYDALHSRGKALENAYFAAKDRQLAEHLKQRLNAEELKKILAYSLGLTGELAHQGFAHLQTGIEIVAAMALLPLVEVAWCDGEVTHEEKAAIQRAALEMGMVADSPLSLFLQNWIDQRPTRAAVIAWREYVQAFCAMVEPVTAATVKATILERAEKVARAAGGVRWSHVAPLTSPVADRWMVFLTRGEQRILARARKLEEAWQLAAGMVEDLDSAELGDA